VSGPEPRSSAGGVSVPLPISWFDSSAIWACALADCDIYIEASGAYVGHLVLGFIGRYVGIYVAELLFDYSEALVDEARC